MIHACKYRNSQPAYIAETLTNMGIDGGIGLQLGEIPADFGQKFKSALAPIGEGKDCTAIVHHQRETKSGGNLK